MEKHGIYTDSGPVAGAPYTPAVRVGDMIFISGQIPLDPATGQLVDGGIEAQTARALDNLTSVVAAAGLTLGDVVKTTVFLVSMDDFPAMNEVYARYFDEDPPARSTIGVAALPKGARVEIEAIAAA